MNEPARDPPREPAPSIPSIEGRREELAVLLALLVVRRHHLEIGGGREAAGAAEAPAPAAEGPSGRLDGRAPRRANRTHTGPRRGPGPSRPV